MRTLILMLAAALAVHLWNTNTGAVIAAWPVVLGVFGWRMWTRESRRYGRRRRRSRYTIDDPWYWFSY